MKTKQNIFFILFSIIIFSSCNGTTDLKTDETASLKTSLQNNAVTLSTAVGEITNTPDFQMMSGISGTKSTVTNLGMQLAPSAADAKVDSVQISLADILGNYNYSWTKVKKGQFSIMRFFDRTANSTDMIVKLPATKVKNPAVLFIYQPKDSLLGNNFEVQVSNYLLKKSTVTGFSYNLKSSLKLDNAALGMLDIQTSKNKMNGYNYLSSYQLSSGYNIVCQNISGDTLTSVYSIAKDNKTLFEEKTSTYKVDNGKNTREKVYSLTLGNVKIVRTLGLKSFENAKVYLDGDLQSNAKVEIVVINSSDDDQTVLKQTREMKITFEDGTSKTIKELTNNSIDKIGEIFRSVRQAYFATDIIDRISQNIYWNK
jgi:hypothetical protein